MSAHQAKKIPKHRIERIRKLKRKQFQSLLHHAHKRHKISYKTLYYIKSFGHDKHIWHAILKQSLGVVLVASVVSTFGGLWLQSLEAKLTLLLPLLIMVPALNDMIGDMGTILSSKFSTYLYMGRVSGKWWKCYKVKELITSISVLSLISSFYIAIMCMIIAMAGGFAVSISFFFRVIVLSVLCTMLLCCVQMLISFAGGYLIFKRGDDPNNFLIPITTAVADLTSLIMFSVLVTMMF